MSIDEYEDNAVRGLLGTAFAEPEPPLRDLASGSIARGDAARRRNRVAAAGGTAVSVAAVVGTFAVVAGVAPMSPSRPASANQATSPAVAANPSVGLGFGPGSFSLAKDQDIRRQLTGLLQPLLPAGVTAGDLPAGSLPSDGAPTRMLTGASGTNQASMWVGTAPTRADVAREVACPLPGKECVTRSVDGGTVYIDQATETAADVVVKGATLPADVLKPGAANDVVGQRLIMTFVPTDHSEYAFSVTVSTTIRHPRYADEAPEDFVKNQYGAWPPTWISQTTAYDPSGLLVTPDDFVAMLAKPGLAKVESLLDPRTAVSQDTKTELAAAESQIAAAADAALPAGVRASVDGSDDAAQMVVTGPSGKNVLTWQKEAQSARWWQQTFGFCPPNVTCNTRLVPGGKLLTWVEKPADSTMKVLSDTPSAYEYWYVPDDSSKPALSMTLSTPVGRDAASDRSSAPAQVSEDQFLAVAENGKLATAIDKTAELLRPLQ